MRALRFLALLISGSIPLAIASAASALEAGDAAPAFSLPGSDGRTHRLADYKGKWVLIEFWAYW